MRGSPLLRNHLIIILAFEKARLSKWLPLTLDRPSGAGLCPLPRSGGGEGERSGHADAAVRCWALELNDDFPFLSVVQVAGDGVRTGN